MQAAHSNLRFARLTGNPPLSSVSLPNTTFPEVLDTSSLAWTAAIISRISPE
jgi:hypothetical protein